jgi:DNA-binding FrmR family transcriptional regulator
MVMAKKARKNTAGQRLNIIKGQINGVAALIEKGEDCRKVTEQLYAIQAGLKKVIELYFQENLSSCLKSVNFKKRKTFNFLLEQIIKGK